MEIFILVVALVLWMIGKKLSSLEKEAKKQERRFPAPTPWRDPWGERSDPTPFPDEKESWGESVRPPSPSPSVTEPVKREIQSQSEMIGDAAEGEVEKEKGEVVQEAISTAKKSAEADLKVVQSPLPPLRRKKRRPLSKGLFTKDSLVRGIIMREILGPAPSHRHIQRLQRRAR